MHILGGSLHFDHEVDDARWLSAEAAAELLTYERDLALLRDLS